MNARQVFEQAQQDYKEAFKELEAMKSKYIEEHAKALRKLTNDFHSLHSISELIAATEEPRAALKNEETPHGLYKELSTHHHKTNQELQESKNDNPLESLTKLDSQDSPKDSQDSPNNP